VYSPN
jgi:hypothetical protein